MTALTAGAILLIISASREPKLRKSVRYAMRSSRDVLIRRGSTSCVKTGQRWMSGSVCDDDESSGVCEFSVAVGDSEREEWVSVLLA